MIKTLNIRNDKNIDINDIIKLYSLVGWQKRDPFKLDKAIKNSLALITLWKEDILIASARATGDGVFNATVWDAVVHPKYQGFGIGKFLIKSIVEELDEQGVDLVTLYTSSNKRKFYEKLGFKSDVSSVLGMYKHIR